MLDIVIIGSGPAGLSAAIYAKRANLDIIVVEKKYMGIGQISESNCVDNYPGLDGISGYDLGMKFRVHAQSLGADIIEDEVCSLIKPDGEEHLWKVILKSGKELDAKTVIFAGGCRNRRLGIDTEEMFIGKGVSYCAVCDGNFFKNRTVAVVGGGNTALDDALYLSDICKKVYIIHRRSKFRGLASTLSKLKEKKNVEIVTNANVSKICGGDKVEEIELDTGEKIALDGVFLAIGMIPQTEILNDLGILNEYGYVNSDENCTTALNGFFVAGDARSKNLRQIVTAVSDGANAVSSVMNMFFHTSINYN